MAKQTAHTVAVMELEVVAAWALVVAMLLPALAALVTLGTAPGPARVAEPVVRATGAAAVLALPGAVAAWRDPLELTVAGHGIWLDRVGALAVVLVAGVASIVASFAARALRGEAYATRFFALAGLLASASMLVATAARLSGLVVAWLVVSACVVGLVGLTGTPDARRAARRTRLTLAVGDVALVLAATIVALRWGDLDLRGPRPPLSGSTGWVVAAGLLVLLAAMTRSAQVPAHRWLIGTVWAPTPVSALLHAGVVNAGGLLLIRTWGIVGVSAVVTYVALVVGTSTLVTGTLRARSRGDAKGALAESTVAQMGFMTMTCALGAHAAALLHLLAHGLFKAALFLGAGSAVATVVRARRFPRLAEPLSTTWRIAAVVVPAAPVVGAVAVALRGSGPYGTLAGELLIGFCVAAAAVAVGATIVRRQQSPGVRITALVVTGAAAAAYMTVVHAVVRALLVDLPEPGDAVPGAWWLVPVAVSVGLAFAVVHGLGGAAFDGLRTQLYARSALPHPVAASRPARIGQTRVRPPATADAGPAGAPVSEDPA